jgi:hypothetical protein
MISTESPLVPLALSVYYLGMTASRPIRTHPVTYAMIQRRKVGDRVIFSVLTKTTDDVRRWPSVQPTTWGNRAAARSAAEAMGAIVIKNWYEIELTAEESAAQYS